MSAAEVSAIAAVASAIASAVAIYVASKSASAAKKSSEVAAQVFHRSALRELAVTCREVISERQRIEGLCIDLRAEFTFLFNSPGSFGGSAHEQSIAGLDKDLAKARDLAAEAQTLVEDSNRLLSSSATDMDQTSSRIGMAQVELRTIRESIERHLADTRARNNQRRAGNAK